MYTVEQKRSILNSSNGKFFNVKFKKKDGSVREATCKTFIENRFASGDRNNVEVNPATTVNPALFTAVDVNKPAERGWININLNDLIEAKVNGVHYSFE
jgi:hypothetical protein